MICLSQGNSNLTRFWIELDFFKGSAFKGQPKSDWSDIDPAAKGIAWGDGDHIAGNANVSAKAQPAEIGMFHKICRCDDGS